MLPPPDPSEELRHTNVLLESIESKFTMLVNGQRELDSKLKSVKMAVEDLDNDVKLTKPIVQRLTVIQPIVQSLAQVPNRLDNIDKALERVESRLDRVESRLDKLEKVNP